MHNPAQFGLFSNIRQPQAMTSKSLLAEAAKTSSQLTPAECLGICERVARWLEEQSVDKAHGAWWCYQEIEKAMSERREENRKTVMALRSLPDLAKRIEALEALLLPKERA